jgi:hypothetical protein
MSIVGTLAWAGGGKMARSLAASYGAGGLTAGALSTFYDGHIHRLKSSDNETMERTGRVLEAAVAGYGIGYVAPVAIIAAGQLILGNPLSAVGEVGSAAILSNPLAATCAALGALYYGYQALNSDERERLLSALQEGLEIGRELISSIIGFAERTLNALLNSETLKALKTFVAEYAGHFGRNLAQITKSVGDHVVLAAHKASAMAFDAAQGVGATVYDAASGTKALANSASRSLQQHGQTGLEWMAVAASTVQERLSGVAARLRDGRTTSRDAASPPDDGDGKGPDRTLPR